MPPFFLSWTLKTLKTNFFLTFQNCFNVFYYLLSRILKISPAALHCLYFIFNKHCCCSPNSNIFNIRTCLVTLKNAQKGAKNLENRSNLAKIGLENLENGMKKILDTLNDPAIQRSRDPEIQRSRDPVI